MCGVTGAYSLNGAHSITEGDLRQMLAMIRHRGPDQFGIYLDQNIGLGNARLSIIDISSGQQPISNEDGTVWIVFNGEIFNYIELRPDLEARGHRFATNSDTEVIVHMYEEYGADCLNKLNGQFVFAIWDAGKQNLFIARDRLGVRPLFYTVADGKLLFGSEIKALLADPAVQAEIDPLVLHEIFTFWSPLTAHTVFKGISQLPPGHYMQAGAGKLHIAPYWQLQFDAPQDDERSFDDYLAEFRDLLIDATQIRLRADVPVGAYLSGGLDSSTIAAIIRNYTSNPLKTFSITFDDPAFDESGYQRQMAEHLGTDHHIVHASHADIGAVFPDVIWHCEVPLLRTSPAPMFLLSRLVRQHNFKVVMTGEGADEFLAGYDIFKEDKLRRFWAKNPDSALRSLLVSRLYPYIDLNSRSSIFLYDFFRQGMEQTDRPHYTHMLRWNNTSRARRFFADGVRTAAPADWQEQLDAGGAGLGVRYPAGFEGWHPLHKVQYLEISLFMSEYLLSAQGDRVAMANAVEGRYPFLDVRVVEFCNRLPPQYKLRGLTEKFLLKRLAKQWIPDNIWKRNKQPYRAPIHRSFFNERAAGYTRDLLSPEQVGAAGYFNPAAVAQLVKKVETGAKLSETDDMALVGVLSTQLVHRQFVADFRMPSPLSADDDVKVCHGSLSSIQQG